MHFWQAQIKHTIHIKPIKFDQTGESTAARAATTYVELVADPLRRLRAGDHLRADLPEVEVRMEVRRVEVRRHLLPLGHRGAVVVGPAGPRHGRLRHVAVVELPDLVGTGGVVLGGENHLKWRVKVCTTWS